jgi:hypothetical protein
MEVLIVTQSSRFGLSMLGGRILGKSQNRIKFVDRRSDPFFQTFVDASFIVYCSSWPVEEVEEQAEDVGEVEMQV